VKSGHWWWAVPLLLGGMLAGAYLFAGLRWTFLPGSRTRVLREVSLGQKVVPLVLAGLAMALGLRSVELLALFDAAVPW
jgi:multicomponent Na+:H+ antiporter subunit D